MRDGCVSALPLRSWVLVPVHSVWYGRELGTGAMDAGCGYHPSTAVLCLLSSACSVLSVDRGVTSAGRVRDVG